MSKGQRGFALIEGLLILIVAGILAGTGWYVWNSRTKADKSLDNSAKTSAATKEPVKANANVPAQANIPADWLTYTDTANNIGFSYPPTWKAAPIPSSKQAIYITSPDIQEQDIVPFGGTKVVAGAKIYLVFQAQTGKTLDQIFSSSFQAHSSNNIQKESRQIDGVPAYEFEFSYESSLLRNIIFTKGAQYFVFGELAATDISKTSPYYDTFIKILDSVAIK